MIDQARCSLIMCTVIGTLTQCLTSCAKLFAMTSIASTNCVCGMLAGGNASIGVGCHGTALGLRLVNPGRPWQHRARLSTGKLCQGTERGGGTAETVNISALFSSPCKSNAKCELDCDRGVLSGIFGISFELQVSKDMSFDPSEHEHPSVEAWLSGLENGSTNDMAILEDGLVVWDSRPTSGNRMIGEDRVRFCAP